MRSNKFVVAVILVTAPLFSQSSQEGFVVLTGPGPTLEEQLEQHHIALTQPALVAALRNSDPEVRDLAAQKLAEDKATETIPAIEQALKSESIQGTKLNIAFSLAQMGNDQGIATLTRTCSNSAVNTGLRLRAASYMLDLDNDVCFAAVNGVLQSRDVDDASYRMVALSLVPRFKHIPKEQSQELFRSVIKCLADVDRAVRISAADAFANLGDATAIPYLKNAISTEPDETVRGMIENALQQLQPKK